MNEIKDKIKLVIWDLDETFWGGTLSEEGIKYDDYNHKLVVKLSQRGIVNSICSKNDFDQVKTELKKRGVWDYFVFPEINWEPKGRAVQSIISDMGLRDNNVLFLDDNLGNLNEVEFVNTNISACEPHVIESLLEHPLLSGKDDHQLTRLAQYKVLEEKRKIKTGRNLSNIEFLRESAISVDIKEVDDSNLERVLELVERTNQLNYTKLRQNKNELVQELTASDRAEVIQVRDKFGDYGISGFFLIKHGKLIHFLFSCRTMNMGVENWLYRYLDEPELIVSGDVATEISKTVDVSYINKNPVSIFAQKDNKDNKDNKDKTRYLILGGCDLDQVVHYIGGDIETEFNIVNQYGISVHSEHTCILNNNHLSGFSDSIYEYENLYGINLKSRIDSNEWDVLIYSPLNDYSRALYRHKKLNYVVPFDAYKTNWVDMDSDQTPKHLEKWCNESKEKFKQDFEYLGPITTEDFYKNIRTLATKYSEREIFILTGSEVELSTDRYWEQGMECRHRKMNLILEQLENELDNVSLVDVRTICKAKEDHSDNIRHYSKEVYYKIAQLIVEKSESLKLSSYFVVKASKISIKIKSGLRKLGVFS
jgi:FkbH-like protein